MIRLPLTTLDTYKVMTISVIRQSTAYIEDILEVKCQYYHSHRYTTNDYIILLRSFNWYSIAIDMMRMTRWYATLFYLY